MICHLKGSITKTIMYYTKMLFSIFIVFTPSVLQIVLKSLDSDMKMLIYNVNPKCFCLYQNTKMHLRFS